jgi:hypothetical protein
VKGKVKWNGEQLGAGTVMFTTSDNRTGSATIDPDGNYTMGDAPIGEVTITVTVPEISPAIRMKGGIKDMTNKSPVEGGGGQMTTPKMPATFPQIPEKYTKVESSPLKYTVKKGEHTFNIDLTPN